VLVRLIPITPHEHVLKEMGYMRRSLTKDSYLVVFDTLIEDMPDDLMNPDRPWGKGN